MSKKTFEEAMQRLEEIVSQLELGNLALDESLKIFEEGMELTRFCEGKLNEADKKIKLLVQNGRDFELKSTDL